MELSEKIKQRRNQLGLTLQEVSEYLDVSKPTVQRYESGEIKNLKQETIQKLSEVLKISPGWLMGWLDDEGNPTREYIQKKSFVTELLETMVRQGLITDVNNIDDNMMKMIVDAIKLEASKIIKDRA